MYRKYERSTEPSQAAPHDRTIEGRSGLGLSLAGNKDRSRMSVFIVGIDPNGAAGKDGQLQIADELLEVSSYGKRCIYSLLNWCDEPSVSRKPTWVSYRD